VERILRECRIAQEEKRMLQLKLSELEKEFELIRGRADGKKDDSEALERELRKLQERHRETIAQVHALSTVKDHLEASVRQAQDQLQQLTLKAEEQTSLFRHERAELQARLTDLLAAQEKGRRDRDA
jgi:chromosome segregation ATPase